MALRSTVNSARDDLLPKLEPNNWKTCDHLGHRTLAADPTAEMVEYSSRRQPLESIMGVTNATERRNKIGTLPDRSRCSVLEGWVRYTARDGRLDRDVAIKVLPECLAGTAEALARFERKAKILAAVSHPNLVTIFDVGTDHGIGFAVMEFLDGETLRELLGRGTLPLTRVLEIGTAIAEGLAAAHAHGVIHRDLKPANIFLSASGQVKILDFGLARYASVDPLGSTADYLTEAGRVMGTVGYMSPEQASGAIPDERGDIFALGCVLYEMATGRRAFPGDSRSRGPGCGASRSASGDERVRHTIPRRTETTSSPVPRQAAR